MGAVQNYYDNLQELENEELETATELPTLYVECVNVGARVRDGFENTNELKPMKYDQAINGPDAEAWKEEINNKHT